MNRWSRWLFVSCLAVSLYGQSPLPEFKAETLAGRKMIMPGGVHGHDAILVVGFTHASGPRCTEWMKRLEKDFKSNEELEIYATVFLEDAPKLARGMAKMGIKSGLPKEEYDHYLIVTEHEKEIKEAVHFAEPDDAYLVLLGVDGTVKWTFHGAVGDEGVKQIRERLR